MVDLSDFKVSHYPDGHKHVVSTMDLKGDTELSVSIRTFDDLFLISQILEIHPEIRSLKIKYLLAARCDRRFSPGEAIDLKIVCDYLYRLNLEDVIVVKPHNPDALKKYLPNVRISEPTGRLIDFALEDISAKNICFISPDAGAAKWVSKCIPVKANLVQCSKYRDANGVVFGTKIDGEIGSFDNFVIVDDLCDGGRTFTEISKEIRLHSPQAKVYLVVTHAIFSKGIEPFEGHIDRIYCTNSFATFTHPLVKQIKL